MRKPGTGRVITAIGAIAAALALSLSLLLPARSVSAAAGDIAAVFGSVLAVDAQVISLATDAAVVKMRVDSETGVRIGDVEGSVTDIEIGDRVAATAVEGSGGVLLAKNILVRPKTGVQIKHVVGVVVGRDTGRATVLDRDGNTVTFDLPAGARVPDVGEAITAVTRRDTATGRIEAKATERAEETVQRIEDHLDALRDRLEVESIRKAEQLRQLLQEETQRHLGALAEIAGKISSDSDKLAAAVRDDARAKLEEAREKYIETARKRGLEIGNVQVEGSIVAVSEGSFTLNLRGGGQAVFLVNSGTRVVADGVETDASGIVAGAAAVVEFESELDAARPVALRVKVSAPKLSADAAANLKISAVSLVDGVITRVDSPSGLDNVIAIVIVVSDESGPAVAIKSVAATRITLNGKKADVQDLKAGLRASVSFDQNLQASAIRAYAQDANQRAIEGVLRKIDFTNRVVAIAPPKGDIVVVSVDDDAQIEKDGNVEATFELLEVNDFVLAGSRFDRTTGEVVRLIVRSPNFQAEGVISGVSREDRVVTIRPREGDSFKLLVTGESEIVARAGGAIGLASLAAGQQVQVAWRVDVVGGATRNTLVRMMVFQSEIESIQGKVVRVDPDAGVLVIEAAGGRNVELRLPDAGQKVELSKNGHQIDSLRPILPGDEVHKAVYAPPRNLIRSLVVLSPSAVQTRGQLKSVDASAGLLELAVSNEKTLKLAITSDSVLTFKGERVQFERLAGHKQIALVVLYIVSARPGIDGVILAAEAVLLGQTDVDTAKPTPAPQRVEVTAVGTIRAIEGSVWVINDTKFVVVEGRTRIGGTPAVGALAKAALVGERGGTLTAVEIQVGEAPARPDPQLRPTATATGGTGNVGQPAVVTFTGVIQELDQRVWVVLNQKFLLTADSIVHGTPKAGATVKMAVRRANDGTLTVVEARIAEIQVLPVTDREPPTRVPEPVREEVLEGLIQQVEGDVIVLNGIKVSLLPNVLDRVERGMSVKCAVRKTDRGTVEATRCVVVPAPNPQQTRTPVPTINNPEEVVEGVIEAVDGNVMALNGIKVFILPNALEKAERGMRVRCVVRKTDRGTIEASRCAVVTPAPSQRPAPTVTTVREQTIDGLVQEVSGDVIVLGGTKVVLLPKAIERVERGMNLKCLVRTNASGVTEATACAVIANPLAPRPVVTATQVLEKVLDGLVEEVSGDVIVLGRTKVVLLPKAIDRVERGMNLKCLVRTNSSGVIEATACSVITASPTPRPVPTPTKVSEDDIEGLVQEVDGDVIVVNSLKIVRLPGSLDKAERGMKVSCRVRKTDRGVVEAVRCTILAAAPQPTPTPTLSTLAGTISELDGRVWVVDGRKYVLAENAGVRGTAEAGARVRGLYRIEGGLLVVVSVEIEAPRSTTSDTPAPTGY